MKLIKHLRNGKLRCWEIVSGDYTITITTSQLNSQARFSKAVSRQSLRHSDEPGHVQAFRSLTTPMGPREWDAAVNQLLAGVQHVED